MVDFIERLDEVGLLSCLASIFFIYIILDIRVDFCSHFRLLWFTPSHREIFLVIVVERKRNNALHTFQFASRYDNKTSKN
jgi:hypothetical protein